MLLAALLAVAPGPPPAETLRARDCPVWEQEAALSLALYRKDTQAITHLLAADVMVQPQAQVPFKGRSAVLQRLGVLNAATQRLPRSVATSSGDDLAWVQGSLLSETTPGAAYLADYQAVWRKHEGQWQLAIEQRSNVHPPTAAELAAFKAQHIPHCVED